MSSMTATRRVASGSASVDTLRKRERQVMDAAYDLAKKGGAFSISFVATGVLSKMPPRLSLL